MKITAGLRKGMKLRAPRGAAARAATGRIKESVFEIISDKLPGARVLDCFAGAGSLGIEALSRGAARAVFIDINPECAAAIRNNLERAGFRGDVHAGDVSDVLKKIGRQDEKFDIIFLDPPFSSACRGIEKGLVLVENQALAAEGAVAVVRHHYKTDVPDAFGGFRCGRRKKYGENSVGFFIRQPEGMR